MILPKFLSYITMETNPQFVAHGNILCQMCAHVMKLAKSFLYFGFACVIFFVGKKHFSCIFFLRGIPTRTYWNRLNFFLFFIPRQLEHGQTIFEKLKTPVHSTLLLNTNVPNHFLIFPNYFILFSKIWQCTI